MSTTTMSKQERAYATLRQRILDGVYGPGDRLVIDALARELAISQLPVREAIRRLEAEGWIVFTRHAGAQVTPLDGDAWADAITTYAVLEGYVTRTVAPGLGPREIEEMRRHNDVLREAIARFDIPAADRANAGFHGVVVTRCPNPHMKGELERVAQRLAAVRPKILTMIPDRVAVLADEHARIIELVAAGDPDELEHYAREHKLRTVRAYRERWAALQGTHEPAA